jgi:iron(III) transport system permease protein
MLWQRTLWVIAAIWLLLVVVLPIGYMVASGFVDAEGRLSLAPIATAASSAESLEAIVNTLLVGLGVALLSVVIGGLLAFGVARTKMRGRTALQAAIIVSLITPDFLLAMTYIILAGPNAGYLNQLLRPLLGVHGGTGPLDIFSLGGLMLTSLPHGVAYVFLITVPALRKIDPAMEEAARMSGAGVVRSVAGTTLPLVRPALLSGALLAFSSSLAMYGPAQMLGMNVLSTEIQHKFVLLDFSYAGALSLILTFVAVVAMGLYQLSTRHAERYRTLGGKSFSSRPLSLGIATHVFTALGVIYMLGMVVLPYGGMLLVSLMKSQGNGFAIDNFTLSNYVNVLQTPSIASAALNSLFLATGTATIVTIVGVLVAYVIAKTPFRGTRAMDYLAMLPQAIPGTALGLALVVAYLNPPLNSLGLYGTLGILFVAYITRFESFGVRTNHSGLMQLSPELEEASLMAGASRFRTLLRIIVPLLRENILYSWILIFVLAIPELSASVILKGLSTQTISTALLDVWAGNGGLTFASALGMLILVTVCLLLGVATWIGRRSSNQVGFI